MAGRVQVAFGGTPPSALVRGQLKITDSFLVEAIEIIIRRDTGLHGGLHKRVRDFSSQPDIRNLLRPPRTVIGVCPAFLVFGFDKVRQNVVERPSRIPRSGPPIVILRLAPDIKQPVQ